MCLDFGTCFTRQYGLSFTGFRRVFVLRFCMFASQAFMLKACSAGCTNCKAFGYSGLYAG